MRRIAGLIFHHSATSPPDSSDGQRLFEMSTNPDHLRHRGILSKAEYHWIIARNGRLIRCAPDMALLGHCGSDRNYDTIGICCEGNLLIQKLTDAQADTLVSLAATLSRQYGIKPDQLLMHKQVMATACPGLNFPHESIVLLVSERLLAKLSRLVFKVGSRDVMVSYEDAKGFWVKRVIGWPCFISGGRSWMTSVSAKSLGFDFGGKSNVALREFEKMGFRVEYNKTAREVVLQGRKNGR